MSENQLTALRKGNLGFIFQSFNLIDELVGLRKRRTPAGISGHESIRTEGERAKSARKGESAAPRQPLPPTTFGRAATAGSHCPRR